MFPSFVSTQRPILIVVKLQRRGAGQAPGGRRGRAAEAPPRPLAALAAGSRGF